MGGYEEPRICNFTTPAIDKSHSDILRILLFVFHIEDFIPFPTFPSHGSRHEKETENNCPGRTFSCLCKYCFVGTMAELIPGYLWASGAFLRIIGDRRLTRGGVG